MHTLRWHKIQAAQLLPQLPEDHENALKVLEELRYLVEEWVFAEGEDPKLLHFPVLVEGAKSTG